MKLIDKDALVAEINQRIEDYKSHKIDDSYHDGLIFALEDLRDDFIDTLEVKVTDEVKIGETQIYLEDDGGEPPYDGKQWLDLSCTEYEIPRDKFKDGDKVEIFIRKTQKGE